MAVPNGMSVEDFLGALVAAKTEEDVRAIITRLPMRSVPASNSRRPVSRQDFIRMHLAATRPHGPAGHGFSQDNLDRETAYYRFNAAPGFVGLVLDTSNPNGGPDGSLDPAQAHWLEDQLVAVHARYLDPNGQWVTTTNDNQLVVIFSHHNSRTFDNLSKAPGQKQARMIEIVDNQDGTLSIFAVMMDHSDAMETCPKPPYSRTELAALSLELAANDPALDLPYRLGTPEDQNVELVLNRPF